MLDCRVVNFSVDIDLILLLPSACDRPDHLITLINKRHQTLPPHERLIFFFFLIKKKNVELS